MSINTESSSKRFLLMAVCLYASYFVHGVGVITIAQNMDFFIQKFNTDRAGVAEIISFIGIGRLLGLFVFGYMSDRFGRKPMFLIGGAFYLAFFLGLLASPNIPIACVMAFCAGAANSSLDTCCYPALMEAFPKSTGTAVIILKAMVSFGQMLYPMLVSFLLVNEIWYGWGLVIPAVIMALCIIGILGAPFPANSSAPSTSAAPVDVPVLKAKPSVFLEGLACSLFSFTAFSTFYIIVVWMPSYAEVFGGVAKEYAKLTISYYSAGSLICVFITAFLVKSLIRPVHLMLLFSVLSGFAALAVWAFPSPFMCNAASFVIGFTAAGGILQLGVALMSDFFPKSKAQVTSVYMIFGSVANFVVPMFTGYLSKISLQHIMLFDAVLGFATAIISLFLLVRYYQFFRFPVSDLRLGEKILAKDTFASNS